MIRSIMAATLLALLTACATNSGQPQVIGGTAGRVDNPAAADQPDVAAGIRFEGGDGSSMDKAVIIIGATEATGVTAEYAWLHQHFPGYDRTEQALVQGPKRIYDKLDFTTPDGTKHTVYFDISDFFGKY